MSTPVSEEAVMGSLLFETTNEPGGKTVEQKYSHFQLKSRPVGNQTADTLTLKSAPAALESMEQVELVENAAAPFGPEPFGVHS